MKSSLFSVVALVALGSATQGATIIGYLPGNSSSADGVGATVVASGVTAMNLNRGGGLVWNDGGDFNSKGWDDGTDSDSAQTNGNYLEWGFSSTGAVDLTTLDIRYDRSSTGPPSLEILLAVNGGSFTPVFTDPTVGESGENNAGIDLSSFTGVTSATFRLVAWGATGNTGTFDIEDTTSFDGANGLVVSGTPVPEPISAPLLLGLLGLAGLFNRRR